MPSRVGILKEVAPDERRVALVPSIVEKYTKLGVELLVIGANDVVNPAARTDTTSPI